MLSYLKKKIIISLWLKKIVTQSPWKKNKILILGWEKVECLTPQKTLCLKILVSLQYISTFTLSVLVQYSIPYMRYILAKLYWSYWSYSLLKMEYVYVYSERQENNNTCRDANNFLIFNPNFQNMYL